MRLLPLCPSSNSWCGFHGIARAFKVLLYTTQTMASSAPKGTLYQRISRSGDPRVSVVSILDQWLEEGRSFRQSELKTIIKLLRKYKRFHHALQLSEWMSQRGYIYQSLPGDVAVQLDLVSKVHGLVQGEKFFDNIPDTLKTYHVYGALLNCYARANSVEKAETTMQKMRELGFLNKFLSYNVMLTLYSKLGKHKKLEALIQEMEEKGLYCDKSTFFIHLNSYATASDVEGMEKLLEKIESDPLLAVTRNDFSTYIIAANGYLKAGLVEKSLAMLKKSEQLINGKRRGFAYEILLTLSASGGYKDEVYRIWGLRKEIGRVNNMGYFRMISSLIRLDDIEGAEKILDEWESLNTSFDFRIPNLLINAYCRKGLLEKAEAFVSKAVERGNEPTAGTWDHLATGYFKNNQMAKAVELVKKAISANPCGWKLNHITLTACLEYLEKNGGLEETDEFIKLLSKQGYLSHISRKS